MSPRSIAVRLGALLVAVPAIARADGPPPSTPARPPVRATVLTFTPAEHPFLMFGHTSIWIHDERQVEKDRDLVYNFGTFDFGSPKVVPYFLLGRLPYWLSIAPLDWTLATYGNEGRGVRAQELALSAEEVDTLERLLIERAKPEHRLYAYGYTADNCTTRVRDIVDEATKGALRRSFEREAERLPDARNTARKRVKRVLTARPFLGPLLQTAYGPALDRPLSSWDATFLPDDFALALAGTARDEAGATEADGKQTRWARSDKVEQYAVKPVPAVEEIDRHPTRIVLLGSFVAVLGQIIGVANAQAGWEGPPRARRVLAGFFAVLGGVTGLLGLSWSLLGLVSPLLRFNVNVLAASPLAFALLWSAPGVARSQPLAVRRARDVVFVHVIGSAVALILELTGLTGQSYPAFPLAMLFVWLALLLSFAPSAGYLLGGLAKGEAEEEAGGDLGGIGSSATSGFAGVEGCGGATGSGWLPRGAGP